MRALKNVVRGIIKANGARGNAIEDSSTVEEREQKE